MQNEPDFPDDIGRYDVSEDGKMLNELNLGRKVMTFNASAVTATSELPETSQMSRNHTLTEHDFADHQESDSDEMEQFEEGFIGGIEVKKDYGDKWEAESSMLEFILSMDPNSHVYTIEYDTKDSERRLSAPMDSEKEVGSSLQHTDDEDDDLDTDAFGRVVNIGLDNQFSRHPGRPYPGRLSVDAYPDISLNETTDFSDDIPDLGIDIEDDSSELSVEAIARRNMTMKEMELVEMETMRSKSLSGQELTGIWTTIQYQINLDKISVLRRDSGPFAEAVKAYYVDSPNTSRESISYDHSDVLPPFERPCWPKEDNIQQEIYRVFDKSDTWTGSIVAFTIMAFIFISLIGMCMETLPEYRFPNYGTHPEDIAPIFDQLEIICVVIFSVEYFARIYTAGFVDWKALGTTEPPANEEIPCHKRSKRWYFFLEVLNMIDFLAILPFYLEIITNSSGLGGSLTILRLLRLLRVLRLFKLGRHIESIRLYGKVMKTVAPALVILLLFLTFLWVIGSSLMYISEGGEWDPDYHIPGTNITGVHTRWVVTDGDFQPSPFLSVFHSLWWAIATYSLVGYGEIVPSSLTGYAIGILFMIFGIVALSLPIGLVAAAYVDVHDHFSHNCKEDIEYSKFIIKTLEQGEAKLHDLETMLNNTFQKFKDRHSKKWLKRARSYRDVVSLDQ